jgi:hypothetical protein
MEYLLRYDGARNRYVSDPPGIEIWFSGEENMHVTNNGQSIGFIGDVNGYVVSPGGKLIRWGSEINRFESEDGSVKAWYDGAQSAYVVVIDDGVTPPATFRILTEGGNRILTESGDYLVY